MGKFHPVSWLTCCPIWIILHLGDVYHIECSGGVCPFAFVREMIHDSNIPNLKQKLSGQFDFFECLEKNIVSLKLLTLGTQLLIPHLLIMGGTPTLCLASYLVLVIQRLIRGLLPL